jgi:hypothetical protein
MTLLASADQHHCQHSQDGNCGTHRGDKVGLCDTLELGDEVIALKARMTLQSAAKLQQYKRTFSSTSTCSSSAMKVLKA